MRGSCLVLLVWGLLSWCAPLRGGTPPDPVFDLKALLAPPLEARTLKQTDKDGLVTEEVKFFSEDDGGKRVEIFAFFTSPRGARGLPGLVWNQGGLGQATPFWTEFGARR